MPSSSVIERRGSEACETKEGTVKDKGKLVVTYKERLAREMEKWMETKAKIKAIDASDWKREGS